MTPTSHVVIPGPLPLLTEIHNIPEILNLPVPLRLTHLLRHNTGLINKLPPSGKIPEHIM